MKKSIQQRAYITPWGHIRKLIIFSTLGIVVFAILSFLYINPFDLTKSKIIQLLRNEPYVVVYSTTAADDEISQSRYDAVRLALSEVGYQVDEHQIELVLMSNSIGVGSKGVWDKDIEKRNAERTAQNENAIAYIGPADSGAAQISMPILNKAGILQIGLTTTYPGLTQPGFGEGEPGKYFGAGKRTFYRLVADDTYQAKAGIDFLYERGVQNVYVVDDGSRYGHSLTHIAEEYAKEAGIAVVGHEDVVEEETDSVELATSILEGQTQAIYYGGTNITFFAKLLHTLDEEGYTGIVMGGDTLFNTGFQKNVSDVTWPIYATYLTNTITPNNGLTAEDFIELYQETYGRMPKPGDASAYDAVRIILYALHEGSGTRDGVLQAVADMKDFPGAIGFINFNEYGDLKKRNSQIIKIENGGYTLIKNVVEE